MRGTMYLFKIISITFILVNLLFLTNIQAQSNQVEFEELTIEGQKADQGGVRLFSRNFKHPASLIKRKRLFRERSIQNVFGNNKAFKNKR